MALSGYQALLLAAGAGRRFGGGKLLAPWRGRPLVLAALEAALAAPVDAILVVLGHDRDAVAEAVSVIDDPRVSTVFAEDWQAGLSASLTAGLRALPPDSRGVLIFLADMPAIPAGLADQVLAALAAGAPAAQPWVGDRPGHPVGLARTLYPDLIQLRGDAGAGRLLQGLSGAVRISTDDPGAARDVDRPADLA